MPAEDTQAGVAPVVALAVTDEDRMHDSLAQGLQGTDFGFAVRDEFVLITDSQDRADHIAGAERTLADDKNFAGDRAALAGDQVALAWADFSALTSLLPEEAGAALPGGMIAGPDLGGRFILGVHAQADALEMVGLGFSASDLGQPSTEPTRLIQDLPDDTVAALGASRMGDRAVALWEELDKSGALGQAGDPLAQLGLDFPDDLRSILGTDLVVAAFGDLDDPSFGARVLTEDPQGAFDALHGILTAPEFRGVLNSWMLADGGYVLATDDETTSVLSADGGLGETDAFRAAVADPDHAGVIGYVDLAAVIDQLVAQGGDTAEEAAKYSAVEALGYSVDEKGGRVTLRITTR